MRARAGFSLLEVAMATVLFVGVSAAFFTVMQKDLQIRNRQDAKSQLSNEALGALRVIRSELVQAARVTVAGNAYPYYWTTNAGGSSATGAWTAHNHAFVDTPLRNGFAFMNDLTPPLPITTAALKTLREIVYVKPQYGATATGRIADRQPTLDATTGAITWDPTEYDFVIVPGTDGIPELRHRIFGGAKFPDGATVHVLARHAHWLSFTDSTINAALGQDQIQIDLWMACRDLRNEGQQEWFRTNVTMRNKVR